MVAPSDRPRANLPLPRGVDSLAHGHGGLGPASALARCLEEQALRAGQRMRVRVRAEDFEGVLRMVAGGAGVGVGVLPAFALDPKLPGVRLCDEFLHRELVVAWRRGARLDTAHEAVVNGLVAAAARRLDSSFARPRDPYYPMPAATPA